MGTLFDQRPRQEAIQGYCLEVSEILERYGWNEKPTPDQVMAACKVLEVGIKLQSADVLDEQLAGFGMIIQSLVRAIESAVRVQEDAIVPSRMTHRSGGAGHRRPCSTSRA